MPAHCEVNTVQYYSAVECSASTTAAVIHQQVRALGVAAGRRACAAKIPHNDEHCRAHGTARASQRWVSVFFFAGKAYFPGRASSFEGGRARSLSLEKPTERRWAIPQRLLRVRCQRVKIDGERRGEGSGALFSMGRATPKRWGWEFPQ